jgi:hypothetical protein
MICDLLRWHIFFILMHHVYENVLSPSNSYILTIFSIGCLDRTAPARRVHCSVSGFPQNLYAQSHHHEVAHAIQRYRLVILLCVMCYVSCVMCYVLCFMCYVLCVICYVLWVMCHVSCVTCDVLCVICYVLCVSVKRWLSVCIYHTSKRQHSSSSFVILKE